MVICFDRKMLGVLDLIMASHNKVTDDEAKDAKKFFKYSLDRDSDLTWVCFLPRRTTLEIAQKYHLLPEEGNILAYEVPLNLIAGNPNDTRDAFFSLVKDFEDVHGNELKGRKISFLGISVGSMPALFLANRYKTEKVRVVCSTAKLGEGIFSAFAARKIKRDAVGLGFDAEAYDDILDEINPVENIENLPEDIKIVISRFDKYIPYKGGVELAKEIRKIKKNVKVYKFFTIGHFLTMLRVGWLNRRYNFLG